MNPQIQTRLMRFLSVLHRQGLWLSWPFLVAGLALLGGAILIVVSLGERNRLCVLPLTERQTVTLDEGGRVALWVEGPLLTTRFAGLSFELAGSDGSEVKGRQNWFPLSSSGLSRGRALKRLFTVPRAGSYTLRIAGLGATQPSDENHQIVLMRPLLVKTIGCVLGIVLGAGLVIGSLVNFLLRLAKGT